MASTITIKPAEMEAAIASYTSAKTQKLDAIAAMKAAVDALQGAWESEAATIFQEKFAALHTNLMASERVMDDAIADLRTTVDTMLAAEESGGKTPFSNLSVGTAPLQG